MTGKVVTDAYLTERRKNYGDIRILNFFLFGHVSMFTLSVSIRRICVDVYFACLNYHENIEKLQKNINFP